MNLSIITWVFLIIGGLAAFIVVVAAFRGFIRYYRQRYRYSVWPGVALCIFAFVAAGIALQQPQLYQILLFAASAVLVAVCIILDIRAAGAGMGLLAFLLQLVLAAGFALVVIVALIGFFVRSLRRAENNLPENAAATVRGVRFMLRNMLR